MKRGIFTTLPLAAGLTGVLIAGVVSAALTPLTSPPSHAKGNPGGNGNGVGPFQGGNNGNGRNPSRGNAARNSGVVSVNNQVIPGGIRFAPSFRTTGGGKF